MSEFRRLIRPGGERALIVNAPGGPEAAAELAAGGFDLVCLGSGNWPDFSFLVPYRDRIRWLEIQGEIIDADSLNKLTGLTHLYLDDSSPRLDLLAFRQLEVAFLPWHKRYPASFFSLPNLRCLTLSYYAGSDCRDIAAAKGLERLDLRMGGLQSLAGLERVPGLKQLSLANLRKLTDVSAAAACTGLEVLHIEKCPAVADVAFVEALGSLRELFLDCASPGFADLAWLSRMRSMVDILIAVPVQSIDWNCVFELPELQRVVIDTHPGYRIDEAELIALAGAHGRVLDNFYRAGTNKHPAFKFWMNRKADDASCAPVYVGA